MAEARGSPSTGGTYDPTCRTAKPPHFAEIPKDLTSPARTLESGGESCLGR